MLPLISERKGNSLTELDFIAYESGTPYIPASIEAVHAESPNADLHTGAIARQVANRTGASAILSRVSRDVMDLNRPRGRFNYPAVDQYRQTIRQILQKQGLLNEAYKLEAPFLHISLHGMQDCWNRDLEIGTGYGHYCAPAIKQWFVQQVAAVTHHYGVDDIFPGYTFRSVLRDGDLYSATDFMGFGENYHAIQLEVSRSWREHHSGFLVAFLGDTIQAFQQQFAASPSIMVMPPSVRATD